MAIPARDNYLTTEVFTAPPQRLHLMLLDAAVRFVQRASGCFQDGQRQQATDAIVHAEEVLGELLAGLNRDLGGDLAVKTAAVYAFVFRSLIEASANRDHRKLDDALRVLAIERETWRQLCDLLAAEAPVAKGARTPSRSIRRSPCGRRSPRRCRWTSLPRSTMLGVSPSMLETNSRTTPATSRLCFSITGRRVMLKHNLRVVPSMPEAAQ